MVPLPLPPSLLLLVMLIGRTMVGLVGRAPAKPCIGPALAQAPMVCVWGGCVGVVWVAGGVVGG